MGCALGTKCRLMRRERRPISYNVLYAFITLIVTPPVAEACRAIWRRRVEATQDKPGAAFIGFTLMIELAARESESYAIAISAA